MNAEPRSTAATPALIALVAGALAMGISPVFVREAEVGPFASAFWRVGGALPLLFLWTVIEARRAGTPLAGLFRLDLPVVLAGLFFAGDLIFWHLAITHTTVANATFLATMAPVWVALGSGFFIGERVPRATFGGLALCLAGAAFLIGMTWRVSPQQLTGDLAGLATSVFFGAYFLPVRVARRRHSAARITFLSTAITSVVLLAVALAIEPRILPETASGAAAIVGLAFVSHAGGQGLLAFALGHLPAAFSALVIFLEAIAAALFGWVFLGEPVSPAQAVGGVLILAGIYVASPRRKGGAPGKP